MAEKHNPLTSLPRPSVYATRINFAPGDVIVRNGQGHIITGIIDFHSPLYPDGVVGKHYILRRHDWPPHRYIILPAKDVEQPQVFAA